MKEQNYANHVRYYAPHHFIFYPVSLFLLVLGIRGYMKDPAATLQWILIIACIVMLIVLSFMMRQHYALTCQNRIVRLELRFRYFALTGERLELLEDRLSFKQIAALRFASDAELPALVQRAVKEKLTPDAIKRSVQEWLPDQMRV